MAPPANPRINHDVLPWAEERIIFLHVPKTGGTTLTSLIEKAVGKAAMCPEHFNDLPLWPAGCLALYRFFAGHFDHKSIDVIPGARKVVTILREPRARIISTYLYWRAHSREFAIREKLAHVVLAIDEDFSSFLKRIQKHTIDAVDNMYARTFGAHLPMTGEPPEMRRLPLESFGGGEHLVIQATKFLDSCAAVGILEEFPRSASLILDAINLPQPSGPIPKLMNTDALARHFGRVEALKDFALDADANAELEKLTEFDQRIYRHAVALFKSKCGA